MLKQCSKKQVDHIFQLLKTYRASIKHGSFQRNYVGQVLHMEPKLIEGRWYAEIKRTSKFGSGYDWRTMLNTAVLKQIREKSKSTELIDKIISLFVG